MGKLAAALALLAVLSAPAFAQACDDAVIEPVCAPSSRCSWVQSSTRSDRGDVADWQRSDQVYICGLDTELVNVTVNGDRVTVERVR